MKTKPAPIGTSPAGFLGIPEVGILLKDIITPGTAPLTLVQLFAGLRRRETDGFQVRYSTEYSSPVALVVASERAIRGYARTVPVCPALAAWLAPYTSLTAMCAPRHADRQLRRRAAAAGLVLPPSVFRQTYALYRLALTHCVGHVAMEMGVTEVPLRKHLGLPVSGAEAAEFFSLTPEACGRPQWTNEVRAWFAKVDRQSK